MLEDPTKLKADRKRMPIIRILKALSVIAPVIYAALDGHIVVNPNLVVIWIN